MPDSVDRRAPPARKQGLTPRERAALKMKRLKRSAIVVGVLGTGLFSGLAAKASHAAPSSRVGVSPDARLSQLENANNGAFFSVGGASVPSLGNSGAQTSSGGS